MGISRGAVELDETPEIAAIREVKEETGLDVRINSLIGVYCDFDMKYPNGDLAQSICIAYTLDVVGGVLQKDDDETLELQFFSLDETPELFCKQHEELLTDIKTHVSQKKN